MKTLSAATLVAALLVASVIATSVSVLSELEELSNDVRMEDSNTGWLFPMLVGPTLWSRFPRCPSLVSLIDRYSLCLVGGLVAVAIYILRIKLNKPFGVCGVACLMVGAVPFVQGLTVLQANEIPPNEVGFWVAAMLLGVLYASVAAIALALVDLTGLARVRLANCEARSRVALQPSGR